MKVTIILSPPPSPNITSEIINIVNKSATTIIAKSPQNCPDKHMLDPVITEKTNSTIIGASIQVCDEETQQTLYTSYNDAIKGELIKEYNKSLDITMTVETSEEIVIPDNTPTTEQKGRSPLTNIGIAVGSTSLCCIVICITSIIIYNKKKRSMNELGEGYRKSLELAHKLRVTSISNVSSVSVAEYHNIDQKDHINGLVIDTIGEETDEDQPMYGSEGEKHKEHVNSNFICDEKRGMENGDNDDMYSENEDMYSNDMLEDIRMTPVTPITQTADDSKIPPKVASEKTTDPNNDKTTNGGLVIG